MKKIKFYLLFFLLCNQTTYTQNGLSYTEKLSATAKVWGFLKYYHPNVADGKFDWDQELFKILPKIKNSENKEQLSQVYLDWLTLVGQVESCKKCNRTEEQDYFTKNLDLAWLNDQIFTPELSEKLRYIEANRHLGNKYYVSTSKKVGKGKVVITNENEYKNFDWKNEDLRLLTLFRYWNIVEYFFPYKYQTDVLWDDVLKKMIPKFQNPKSEMDFHLAMLELAISTDDSHVRLNSKKIFSFFGYYPPVKFKLVDNKAVVIGTYNDSLALINDLKIGDIITKANDKNIDEIFQETKKYISGSNSSRKRFNANYYILSGLTDSLKIGVIRDGETSTKIVKRYLYKDFGRKSIGTNKKKDYKLLEGNIGYIDLSELGDDVNVPDIMSDLNDTKAIIFDLRDAYAVNSMYYFGHYITSPRKDFYKVLLPDLDYPGKFFWDKGADVGYNKELKYKGKVVLLVDESCQSQCEYTVMCLQTGNNSTTIGSQTSGADGNVVRFNMVGGYETQISGVGIFYPDGTETQRKGVKIDIKVNPTLQAIKNGKDEILEKAIEFINQ